MVNDKMNNEVKEIISNLTQIAKEDIDSREPFINSGIDSFNLVEIVYAIENKYEIDIPQNKIATVRNLDDFIELIRSLQASRE